MEQLMKRDRAAFQELVYDHFKNVEEETKKWEERNSELERVADDSRLRILQLECDLQDAKKEVLKLNSMEDARRKRTLQASNDRSRENKENIDPSLKTLAKEVTPPSDSPAGTPRPPSVSSDEQSDCKSRNHSGMQTDPQRFHSSSPLVSKRPEQSLMQAYNKLSEKYERVQRERNSYKHALDSLKARYKEDKRTWRLWIANDAARRELAKKQRKEEGPGRRQTLSPRALLAPSNWSSSPPRPPVLSPDSSPTKLAAVTLASDGSMFETDLARKGGLFSRLQPSKMVSFPQGLGDVPDGTENAGPTSSDNSSIPKTMEQDRPRLPSPLGAKTDISWNDVDVPGSDVTTSNTGDDAELTPKAPKTEPGQEPMLAPPPYPPEEAPWPVRDGENWAKPVVIKSESVSSQSDSGYHLFEQESLDLDEVGQETEHEQSEMPRKKRKLEILARKSLEKDEVAEMEVPHGKGQDNGIPPRDEVKAPILRGVQLAPTTPVEGSQPLQPKTPDLISPVRRRGNSQPLKPTRRVQHSSPQSTRKGPISTSSPAVRTPFGKSSKRDPRSHRGALIHVLEDGTDGVMDVGPHKNGAGKTQHNTRLDSLLSTPAPRTPSLKPIGKNMRSAPTNKRPRWSGTNSNTPSHSSTPPTRQATTDPKKHSASTVDHFRINPAQNEGLDYAYHETVRNREQRKCLPGCTRTCCKDVGRFVEAAGLPLAPRRGPRWRSSSPASPVQDEPGEEAFVQRYGRHREAFPRRRTPPSFWESDMPDTQAVRRQHEEADRIEEEKVLARKREVEKGGKGRFVRR